MGLGLGLGLGSSAAKIAPLTTYLNRNPIPNPTPTPTPITLSPYHPITLTSRWPRLRLRPPGHATPRPRALPPAARPRTRLPPRAGLPGAGLGPRLLVPRLGARAFPPWSGGASGGQPTCAARAGTRWAAGRCTRLACAMRVPGMHPPPRAAPPGVRPPPAGCLPNRPAWWKQESPLYEQLRLLLETGRGLSRR